MRRALPVALLLATAVPAAAQLAPSLDLTLGVGSGLGSPFSLVGTRALMEWLIPEHARPSFPGGPHAFDVATRYTERLERSSEESATLRIGVNEAGFLEAGVHRGRADARASVAGGVAPRSGVGGRARWSGFTLLAGLRFLDGGPVRAWGYAGRRWDDVYVHRSDTPLLTAIEPGSGDTFSIALPFADRRLDVAAWRFGAEAEAALAGPLSLRLAGEYRIGRPSLRGLGSDHEAALRSTPHAPAQPWVVHRVVYERYTFNQAALSLALTWTFGRRTFTDPGAAALRAVREASARADAPPAHPLLPAEVEAALAAGDSAGALALLERLAPDAPGNAAVLGTLGLLLVRGASSAETDFVDRRRAQALLDRALVLDPGNPRWLLAYGELLGKRGMELDARRVVTRAIAAAVERPEGLTPEELAEAFYQRGLALETHVAEFERLRSMGQRAPPVHTPACEGSGSFCLNWMRPYVFYQIFEPLSDLTSLVDDESAAMLSEYRRALELVPAHRGARRRVLARAVSTGSWSAVVEEAHRYAAAAPDEPWSAAFLGMALVWAGQGREAEPHFRRALAGLEPADRAVFEDLRPLLTREREVAWDTLGADARGRMAEVYWSRADPLFLTSWSEREQEHYARVALAELLFGEPQTGHRGWESPRGQILVRYGRPTEVWQIARDEQLAGRGSGGGRWIFWNYDPHRPSFIFEKKLSFTGVQHMRGSLSYAHQQDLKGAAPTAFEPPFEDAGPIATQVARFRADDPDRWDVAIFAKLPETGLAASPRDTVRRGLFLVHAPSNVRVAADSLRGPIGAGRLDLRAGGVRPGIYRYSIEAASADYRAASVARGELVVGRYAPSGLRVSDLLLAALVTAPADATPGTWRKMDIEPLRCLRVPESRLVGALFELYGLDTADGLAEYRVEIETTEAPATSTAVRLLRGLRNLVDRPTEGTLSYERVVPVQDDRVVEWFELRLPPDHPREVRVRVRVTDLTAGDAVASAERVLLADGCAPGNPDAP